MAQAQQTFHCKVKATPLEEGHTQSKDALERATYAFEEELVKSGYKIDHSKWGHSMGRKT
jgi:hypothetical protein